MKHLRILFLFFSTLSSFGQKDDTKFVEKIAAQLNLTENDYRFAEVKTAPNNSGQSIVLIIKYTVLPFDEKEGFIDYDLILALVDTKTQTIISKFVEEEKYTSDAFRLDAVTLDMADYMVTDNLKAFGVRDTYRGSSGPNPSGSENISLYIIHNNAIEKILDNFTIDSYQGETDMKCYYDGTTDTSILIIDKEKTNGFYNIKVKTSTTISKSRPAKKGDDCIGTDKKLQPTFKTLKFVKGAYILS
jgi:hypothetical protein